MDRRNFLKVGATGVVGAVLPFTANCSNDITPILSGWNPNYEAIKRFTKYNNTQYLQNKTSKSFNDSGKGRAVFLYKYLEKAIGEVIPHKQETVDCVGQAYGFGTDILAATQIYGLGFAEEFKAKSSTEVPYAGSRYEIGYLKHSNLDLLRGGGSWGAYAAQFVTEYGVLPRGVYGDVDLTKYDASLSRLWGRKGIPDSLEPIIKKHPVRSYALVTSYNDIRNSITNGYPVIICSSIGFNPKCFRHNKNGRDSMGFLQRCGTWYHAMCAIAVDDTERPGVLLMNSWGPNWVQGGTRHGQPAGSFWVDANTIDVMCSQGDSYAISGFLGFPSKKLNYDLF